MRIRRAARPFGRKPRPDDGDDASRRPPWPAVREAFLLGDVSSRACGWRVRLVRSMVGWTLEEFAPTIGMTASNLHSVEVGKSYLRPGYAKLLREAYDVTFEFVYYGDSRLLTVGLAMELLDTVQRLPPPDTARKD